MVVNENTMLRAALRAPYAIPIATLYATAGEIQFPLLCRARRLTMVVKILGERFEPHGASAAYKELWRQADLWRVLRGMASSTNKATRDVAERRKTLYWEHVMGGRGGHGQRSTHGATARHNAPTGRTST